MKNKLLYVWLQLAIGICNRVAESVFSHFDNILDIYNCDDFSFLGEKRKKYIDRLENKDTAQAFEILKRCQALNVEITGYYEERYPKSLRLIDDPPVVLYSIGEFRDLNVAPCVGIVGTRNMTDYGKSVAENFAYTLSKSGVYIISGLAKGIDTAAHRGAVMADGYTVGVLGNPIGDVYPKENLRAFETLYKRGLVISEMYPGCPRTKADFPNRNRIISAISDCVIITEAGESSGALITAHHAVAQGKDVFAVPGAVGAENAGTNTLIKTGTPAVTEVQDVLSALVLSYPEWLHLYEPASTSELRSYGNKIQSKGKPEIIAKEKVEIKPDVIAEEITETPAEVYKAEVVSKPVQETDLSGTNRDKIIAVLNQCNPLTADEITAKTGILISDVLTELTMMEIEDEVTVSVGSRYTLRKA